MDPNRLDPNDAHALRFTRSASSLARVLVVDDEAAVRQFVKQVLDESGYLVDAIASGTEGLTRLDGTHPYDLIVADVCMPEMTGPQFIARIRQAGLQTKVLYLTGFADRLFDERNEQLWADEAFLDKPCTVQGLLEAVSLLLDGQIHQSTNRKSSNSDRFGDE